MRLRRECNDDEMHKGGNRDIACRQQNRLRRNWRALRDIRWQNRDEEHRCLGVQHVQQQPMAKPCTERIFAYAIRYRFIFARPCFPSQPEQIGDTCIS